MTNKRQLVQTIAAGWRYCILARKKNLCIFVSIIKSLYFINYIAVHSYFPPFELTSGDVRPFYFIRFKGV